MSIALSERSIAGRDARVVVTDPAPGRFEAHLIDRARLTPAALERARTLQAEGAGRIDQLLVKLGLVGERAMAEHLAEFLGRPIAEASDYPQRPLLEDRLSTKFLRRARIVPLLDAADELTVAMADPLDAEAHKAIGMIAGKPVSILIGVPADIDAALARLYEQPDAPRDGDALAPGDGHDDDVERLKDMASEAPVIRLVNAIVTAAVEARASDVHIEPFADRLRVRYRIDGLLRDADSPPIRLAAAVVSRIKIMAKLNIAERRLPQDGRTKLAVRGKEIDFRVAVLPTLHGEKVVMRILDRDAVALDFARLGFGDDVLPPYLEILRRPHGILLVTGPTGSGKTTTLYTSLLTLNAPEVNILTVEDPIEYQLDGINQVQVKPQIGLSFANTLRSMLRQDPDIIMVGEIRDAETVRIAVQAALTGHMVLSTLHTNDAASTISRLLDMGVEGYLLNSTINAVVAQRLVRRLCTECRQAYRPDAALAAQLRLDRLARRGAIERGETRLWRATGCPACAGTGYHGRIGILELLVLTDAIRGLVLRRAEAREIAAAASAAGMRTMFADGVAKALAGVTSVDEVLRVTSGGGDADLSL